MVRVPPPLLALAAALAQRALTRASPPNPGRAAVAATVAAVSVAMAGSAAGHFRHRGTTLEPFHPDRATFLVTAGANSISRNPMYVGMAGLLVAHALSRGSWRALVPVAGFVVVIDRLQVEAEESALLDKFGDEYESYRAASPRWLDRRSLHFASPSL
ncbi:MAG: isoprenylcysteine carboxylmethyltransferase family protein [Nocardioides sp.]|nr:isoprenylcysteine carboxylmethyltransferase family protein [Nocardioides sp.]